MKTYQLLPPQASTNLHLDQTELDGKQMGRKLWDEAKVCPRTEVLTKGHPVVISESLHHDHEYWEKLQIQYHYFDSENSFQNDLVDLDHGNLYLVPGLGYAVQNLELIVDEHDLLLFHRRKVEFRIELDK
jgi:hypothetical protein